MSRSRWILLVGLMSVVALIASGATAAVAFQDRADKGDVIEAPDIANPEQNSVQYSVKFVCGWLPPVPPQDDQWLKPGDYATTINIHNHQTNTVSGGYRVALFYRIGSPSPPAVAAVPFNIFRRTVGSIDCVSIWAAAGLPPGTFVEGAVHIGLSQPLSVWAVYTSQTHNDPALGPDGGAGHSIDVEQVVPIQAPIG
jgi:hypothetical protein